MNIDTKRHKLLGILTEQRKNVELKKEGYNTLGVAFEDIYKIIDCDENELHSITSELYTSGEIKHHNAHNIVGLFAKDKGVTAFSNKKYHNRVIERRKERAKFFVQTVIPILALIVAILSLSIKFDNLKMQSDKELQKLEDKLLKQKMRIDNMETNLKKSPNDYKNKDSLNVEKN
ncbi:hypothetical protein LNJ05_12940 [Tenacibaculum finnmarkense genomovar ulcerans]|uniref:hypothetical protein n=1 Tax=Tenacibaculum finnmarkense TaxID=2781243 RepID=UPI00187BA048|nr:hypothetical protein [Tenacibaculum finnmarkense]MBE7635195.1 hypothetical protein [Tenacibaculum finnmarkense genomovar ulcerans]MCD8431078.1 hypothetical protein [Tenacibaculum finnmarkense genomovar ulcerans]MCD8433669.1 hypothetical protein [Tenacibaculum finnmarkense genomovar ulcerans]